jgi:hypothetical protein
MDGHLYLDPSQTGAELKEQQKKINDPQNQNDGKAADFHETPCRNGVRFKAQGARQNKEMKVEARGTVSLPLRPGP